MKFALILACVLICEASQDAETSENAVDDGVEQDVEYTENEYDENHKDGPGDGIDLASVLTTPDENVTLDSLFNFTSDDPSDILPTITNTSDNDIEWWSSLWRSRTTPCDGWLPINHYFFHLANFFLLLSYLAPNNIYGLLYLRATLAIGCAFFAVWGWVILCAFDTFLWNIVFVVINVVHICVILWYLRPVCLPEELNEVYETLFKPLKVSKQQFKKTISCIKDIREIEFQGHHAQERITRVETLSLLLRGKMIVSQKGRALHLITRNQFLDSPEWFGNSSDDCFQVTITALEECRVLVWQRDKLRLTLMSDPFLNAVFDHVLGRDVVKKLTQVQDAILAMTGDWMPLEKTDVDEKQALLARQIDDGPQIVAMLNKSYHGLFWNKKLPYIDDGEV